MAQTEHLPIYKAAYDLCLHLEQVVGRFGRAHREVTGEHYHRECLACGARWLEQVRAGTAPLAPRLVAARTAFALPSALREFRDTLSRNGRRPRNRDQADPGF
jgi:hypothetical protein